MKSKWISLFRVGSRAVHPGRVRLAMGCGILGLALGVPFARAQQMAGGGASSPLPEKTYMTKNAMYLPVIVDDRARASLREIHLYVKDGPNAPWQLKQQAPPTQTGFECRLGHDGEYWFNVVTIDLAGKQDPPDLAKEPPAIIVVLDTTAPSLDLKALPQAQDGSMCVKCDIRDANPHPMQTKFEYQTGDRQWRILDAMSNQGDCFCIPRQAVLTGLVKVTVVDRASNATSREFNLSSLAMNNNPVDLGGNSAKTVSQPGEIRIINPVGDTKPVTSNIGTNQSEPVKQIPPVPTKLPDMRSLPDGAGNNTTGGIEQCTQVAMTTGSKNLVVNQTRVSLGYRIEDVGQSGVGKVEVCITKDNGRNWEVLCEVADKKSPAVFDLPGEGTFGIRLAVTNGRGFGDNRPKSGDAPDVVVDLDTIKPQAELRSVKLVTSEDCACMDIAWQASDKNLGQTPIELSYSTNPQGPWKAIASGQPNTGKYRWYLPKEVGNQAFVRMTVTDAAGNCTKCETTQAVLLDDNSRPRAVINTILPASAIVPPQGN